MPGLHVIEVVWDIVTPLVALGGDGRFAASDGPDLVVLDPTSGAVERSKGRYALQATTQLVAADGALFSTAYYEVRAWWPATGEGAALMRQGGSVGSLTASGRTAFFVHEGYLYAWDLAIAVEEQSDGTRERERKGASSEKPVMKAGFWTSIDATASALLVRAPNPPRLRWIERRNNKVFRLDVKRLSDAGLLHGDVAWALSEPAAGGTLSLFRPRERAPYAVLVDKAHVVEPSPNRRCLAATSWGFNGPGARLLVDIDTRPRYLPLGVQANVIACADDGRVVAARGTRVRFFDEEGNAAGALEVSGEVACVATTGDAFAVGVKGHPKGRIVFGRVADAVAGATA
jgi:hypothetical protein